MTVYVDNARIPYGRMLMAHMIADTPEELRDMIARLRIDEKNIQHPGTSREHVNICAKKRKRAIFFGASPVTTWEIVRIIKGRVSTVKVDFQ